MNELKIRGFLNRNYFINSDEIIYTWWRYDVKEYLLKINFKQIKKKEITLGRDDSLVCYKIDVGCRVFNVCELPIDKGGILTVDDGFFEKGDIKEWKSRLL